MTRHLRHHGVPLIGVFGGVFLALGISLGQGASVVDSVHNLSVTGPGSTKAAAEDQVCIFCHTPHNSAPIRPLWNRMLSVAAYSVYSSSSLDAHPGQPTGSSKMCLSCHDGTIALGSVLSRSQTITMSAGITTIPAGSTNLGTDLSDDHPVSFRFDSLLAGQDPKLVNPAQLPPELPLDHNLELQCTTCHDAHDNSLGNFLVMANDTSGLCRSCHQISTTTIAGHAQCVSCHRTHTAPSGPFLLQGDRVTTTCLRCHDGSHMGAPNIAPDLQKFSVHDTNSPVDPPNPIPSEVNCADCHNPHTMQTGTAAAPDIHPVFGDVPGISASGAPIAKATTEYEVCFKCHGDQSAFTTSWVPRVITQTNTRLEFSQTSASYHPVEGPGRNADVPSLIPGLTTSTVIYCSDCHGSDTSMKAGGAGPDGVHGSDNEPLLIARYDSTDFTNESLASFALCYRCHERDGQGGILRDESFKEHRKHVQGENAPCSVCHDPHGISSLQGTVTNNSHLINFDTSIVFPDPKTGLLKFEDLGRFSGQCFLSCHGEDHSPKSY